MNWPRQSLTRFRFIATHGTLRDFDRVPAPRRTFTFLRNPILRSLSLYQYWTSINDAQIAEYGLYKPRFAKILGLRGLFSPENRDQCAWIWNQYATALASGPATTPARRGSLSDSELLDRALANLETLDFVGLTESFRHCFSRLCRTFDIPDYYAGQRANVTLRNHLVDPNVFEKTVDTRIGDDELAILASANTLDQKLYDHVVQAVFPGGLSYSLDAEPAAAPIGDVWLYRGERWVQNKRGGFLITGPYVRMLPGRYRATFTLALTTAGLSADQPVQSDEPWGFLDIASNLGEKEIARVPLTRTNVGPTETTINIEFTLWNVVNDLECRVFAAQCAHFQARCAVVLTHLDKGT